MELEMSMRAKMNELKKNKKGFTLMEMIVVIVIIGILMAILVPGLIKWVNRAKDKQLQANARTAYLAVQGELLERLEKQTLKEAVTTITQDGKAATIAKDAGLTGTFTVKVAAGDISSNGEIKKFEYSEGEGKVATWENGKWTLPSDPKFDEDDSTDPE